MVKRRKKARLNIGKTILISIFFIFLLTSVACFGVGLAIVNSTPPLDVNQILTLNEPSVLYNDKDEFMDEVITAEQRKVIQIKDMPQDLRNAFISIEDERFYKHNGIDPKRITGVVFINIKNKLKRQSGLQGASTITQQLLKNTILSSEVSIKRKLQEMYLAIKLENALSKDQILEAYMNTIFLGGRSWGVEAASEQYFGKKAKDLNLIQCAFIAGVPQSPSVYYPFSPSAKKDPSLYLNRTQTVLKKMYENGYINDEQYNGAINDLANKKLSFESPKPINNKLNYEWFSIPVIEQVKKELKAQYHYSDTEVQHRLMYGGLKIYTTMNKDMQASTKDALNNDSYLNSISYKDKNGIVQPQASAVITDYKNGEVKAIIGGRGEQPPMSFNRAASEKYLRPAGSSIKPLTVYGAAIDSKQASAATVVEDSPLSSDKANYYGSPGNPYNPRNDSGTFSGNVTLRTAITHSINLVALKLEDQIGLKVGADYAEKFGITLDEHDRSSIAALALGELHHGTNTLTMSAAYGTFGNGGTYTSPKLYRKVTDRNGKVLLENKHSGRKILSPESAYIMYDMLKGPVSPEGTAPRANFGSMPVRGKTGTSGDSKNLWFCGLTPYYSAAVWIGNDDNSVCSGINSNIAAGLWSSIMQPAHKSLEPKDIEIPAGITTAAICQQSGKLANSSCYSNRSVYNEFFLEGTAPSSYCNVSHSFFINPFNNGNTPPLNPWKKDDNDKNNNTNNPNTPNNNNNGTSTETNPVNPPNIPNNNTNGNNENQSNTESNPNNVNPKKPGNTQ